MSKLSDYFTHKELACKHCGVKNLDPNLERELLVYRETVNIPLNPNSCCRCATHNHNEGGAKESYHLFEGVDDGRDGTLAIDLNVRNDTERAVMIAVALNLGWSVGIYRTFIHIDRRVDIGKKQKSFWGKY